MKIGIFDHLSIRLGGSQYVVARMAETLSRSFEVDLIHGGRGYRLPGLADAFNLDLSGVRERIVADSSRSFSVYGLRSARSFMNSGFRSERALTSNYDLFIYSGHGAPPVSHARRGMVYCHFPFEGSPAVEFERLEHWRRRKRIDRWLRIGLLNVLWRYRMRGYAKILANSHFTASWIERLWGRSAQVVYPPVSLEPPQADKQNIIVSLGRIVDTDRKQLRGQLQAFPRFLEQVGGNWQLLVMGFCTDFPQDRAYLGYLTQLAEGLPVTFIVNADRGTIISKLAAAKLFWHTTGLGGDETIEPRYMEHFGIATVEAMRAGCVPLVPDCGGQPEIVNPGVNGFVCRDFSALVSNSVRLANEAQLLQQIGKKAVERSMAFSAAAFDAQISSQVKECLGIYENSNR